MHLVNTPSVVSAVFADGLFRGRDACAVHQTHQLAHGNCFGDDGLAIGFIADIALYKGAANFLGNGFAFFGLHVGNDYLAALGRQHARCAFAQARCAAGDDKYLACDVHEMLLKMEKKEGANELTFT